MSTYVLKRYKRFAFSAGFSYVVISAPSLERALETADKRFFGSARFIREV